MVHDTFADSHRRMLKRQLGGGGLFPPTRPTTEAEESSSAAPSTTAPTSSTRPVSSTSASTPSTPAAVPTTTSTSSTPTTSSTSTTPSTTSTTASSTSVSTSTTPTTTSTLTTPDPVETTTRSIKQVTRTATFTSSDTSLPSASSSAGASSSGAKSDDMGTGTIIGIAVACLAGIAVLSAIIVVAMRRYRRKKDEEEAFSASQFRQSAVMLDDEIDGTTGTYNLSRGNSQSNGNYTTHLRPPTMIERHMNNSPASFGSPQYGYGPQPSFGPAEVMGQGAYNEQDIRAGPYDGDPFSPANTYLTRQPSSASGMYHPQPQEYDYQQYPGVPAANYPAADYQHQAQYSDLNRVPSLRSSDSGHGPAIIASAGVAMPASTHHSQSPPPRAAPEVGAVPNSKRPDTVYDPDDAYGGM